MFIQTERLQIKPMAQADVGALVELFTDAVVGQTYMVPPLSSREEAMALASRIVELSQNPERYVAGIYLGETLIGLMNETGIVGSQVELGYAILPHFHNCGYATEALQGAIPFFFAQGFREVLTGAFEENLASLRVMVKCGMTLQEHQDEIEYRGKVHRCVYYAIRPTEESERAAYG